MLQFKPRSGMFITCVALARPLCASISPSRDDYNCRISLTGFWWRLNKVVLLKDCLACASHSVNEKSWPIRPPSSSRNPKTSLKDKACGILKGREWDGVGESPSGKGQVSVCEPRITPRAPDCAPIPRLFDHIATDFQSQQFCAGFIFFLSVLGPTCPALVAGKKARGQRKYRPMKITWQQEINCRACLIWQGTP